jgi:hypothetical protein
MSWIGMKTFESMNVELKRLQKPHKEAARELGITPVWFSFCLHGKGNPSDELLARIEKKMKKWARMRPLEL